MQSDIDQILIPQPRIAARVAELAAQILADHASRDKEPIELTILPILTGAMVFCADLIRQMPIAMRIGLLTVSSYPGKSLTSRGPQVLQDQLGDLRGQRVLVLDEILDSGGTLRLVVPLVQELGAASVRTCVLLRKDRPAARSVATDYVGFDIPDAFVVGYGLDFNNYYRNLPDIVTLKEDVIRRET
jgi:hypoxanthine phosphoribosyltransferase